MGMEMEWCKRHVLELTYKGLDIQLNVHSKEEKAVRDDADILCLSY